MAKCPECGSIIHWLKTEAVVWSVYMLECRVKREKEGMYREAFRCPACGEEVVDNLTAAKEFLKE